MNIMNNPKHAIVDIYLSTYKRLIYIYYSNVQIFILSFQKYYISISLSILVTKL